jgi:ferrous iron transport protein A
MNLAQAAPQKSWKVIGYTQGHGVESKLRQLGILPGCTVNILRQAPFAGPLMVEVNGRSVALGVGVAEKVLVEEVECESR